jgi:putative tryptophan/tyrosine transport system substrate-binding protein
MTEEATMQCKTVGVVVVLILGLLAVPLLTDAQPAAKVWRLGLFHVGLDHVPASLDGLREGLKGLGYEEGKNLHLDWRNLPDEAAARATAQAFVREQVDLIIAFENQTIQAAQAATTVIPVVMVHANDPVANGFVQSLAHPGGNLTGQAAFAWEGWYAKKLELFKELVPHLRRVLVLVDPHDPLTPRLLPEVQRAAASLQLHTKVREATTQAEIEQLFSALTPGEVEGVFTASNNLETNFPSLTMRLALAHRLPMPVPLRQWVVEGGLFYYGIDERATGRTVARSVDKLLKGTPPAELPIEQPTTFNLVINLKTAKDLGLKIPPTLLFQATEVIQ